ncbi:hypothetical protein M0R45_030550 [Rubus argutus]|uniref:Pentatricopeptide repeat-containing protein n=1 Tax=Rubus argutus TaxID=59490 RepID=A0AAW1WDD2_RUBAR
MLISCKSCKEGMAQSRFSSLVRLPLVRRLSSSLPNPTTQNDAELVSKILLHHHNPFHAMESSLQLHGITLSADLLHHTLLRLKHNSKIALAFFHYAKSLPDPPLTADSFNLLIDIVAKVRQYDVAWQLILEMDSYNLTPHRRHVSRPHSPIDLVGSHPPGHPCLRRHRNLRPNQAR